MRRSGSRCGNVTTGALRLRVGLALAALAAAALPGSGASLPDGATAIAGSVTVVVHGQGRVTSSPAGTIDCPGTCSFTFTAPAELTLRAVPADGWATAELAFCGERSECTITLNDFPYTLHAFFRPRALLQLWPNGEGGIAISPPGTDHLGEPTDGACTRENATVQSGCELYYLPGTSVTATATAAAGRTFLGWSAHGCPGAGRCVLRLADDGTTLVARFTPLDVRVRLGGDGTGSVVSEPAGIACPPTCEAPFAAGSPVTLVARPDPAAPFLSWKFGCTPSATDPSRCTLTTTNWPNWVGIALGRDDEIGEPTTVSVLFDVAREGQGAVVGRELDCGSRCEHLYRFGTQEELRARPASGWRFTQWRGACARATACVLHVGPVTSVSAVFTENLVPKLLRVRATGRAGGRRIAVRVSVRHAAQLRLRLRRDGSTRVLADRRYALRAGSSTVALRVPARAVAGRYRLSIAVSDGLGGGRTYTRVLRLGS
jgi:hypothetical protein